jgi:hypothetical protein
VDQQGDRHHRKCRTRNGDDAGPALQLGDGSKRDGYGDRSRHSAAGQNRDGDEIVSGVAGRTISPLAITSDERSQGERRPSADERFGPKSREIP